MMREGFGGSMFRILGALLSMSIVAMISACSPSAVTTGAHTSPAAQPATDADVQELFRFVSYRYAELERPTDLNRLPFVDVTAMAEVIGFEEGPAYWSDLAADPEAEIEGKESGLPPEGRASEVPSGRNMIMRLSPVDLAKGSGRITDEISVLLPAHSGQTPESFAAALRPGTRVVVYLSPATDLTGANELWKPVSPQGFIVDGTESGVLFPLAHETDKSSLAANFPG